MPLRIGIPLRLQVTAWNIHQELAARRFNRFFPHTHYS
jgi:hypothetical protein